MSIYTVYKAHTATMFDMYCRSQFSYTVHLITVTHRSPFPECRCHENKGIVGEVVTEHSRNILLATIRAGNDRIYYFY